jgi:hypothetical protein
LLNKHFKFINIHNDMLQNKDNIDSKLFKSF